jgi:hypothetical protein
MIHHRQARLPLAFVLLSSVACGCNLPFWNSGEGPTAGSADTVSRWHGASQPTAKGMDHPEQAITLPAPRIMPMNDQISLMSQRLASTEDDRKVLASRMHMLEVQLEEKDKALASAAREIQECTAKLVSTRNELAQWQKDMKTLRDRYRTMEKDNRETLEATIKTLEQYLERDKSPAKGPATLSPELLPWPPQH